MQRTKHSFIKNPKEHCVLLKRKPNLGTKPKRKCKRNQSSKPCDWMNSVIPTKGREYIYRML